MMKLLFVVVLALVATVSAQGEAEVATPAATPVDLTPVTQKLEQVRSSILSEVAKSNVGDLTKSLQAQQAKLEQLQTLLSTQGESSKQLGSTLNTLTTNFNSLREELGKKQPAAPQQTSGDSDAKLKAVEKKLDSVADLLMKLADSVKQTNERVLTLSKTFDVAHDQTLSLLKNATAAQEGAFAHSMKCVTTWYTETVKPFAAVAYERAGVQFAHFSAFANEHGGVALQEARKLGNKLYKDAKVHGVAAAMKADAQLQQLLEEKASVPRQHVQIASQAILGFTALVAAILVFYLLKFVLCAVLCCGMCRKQPRPVAPAAHEPATSNSASKKKK